MSNNNYEINSKNTQLFTNSNYFSYLQSVLMMLISTAIFHNVCLGSTDFNLKICGITVILCQLIAIFTAIASFKYAWDQSENTMTKKDKVTRMIIDSNLIILAGLIICFNIKEMILIFFGQHDKYD